MDLDSPKYFLIIFDIVYEREDGIVSYFLMNFGRISIVSSQYRDGLFCPIKLEGQGDPCLCA